MGKSLEGELARYFEKKIAIERIKEKHRLCPWDLVKGPKEELPERVKAYTEELDKLLEQWRAEDATETESQQKAPTDPPRKG